MKKSSPLQAVLAALSQQALRLGYTDTEWARRAAVRKETLSRLRHRESCDFGTLQTLAMAVGARLGVVEQREPATSADGHFPSRVDRDYEQRLVDLCASGTVEPQRWAEAGPRFFMAGLAVMLASVPEFERGRLLSLAETLHPGATEPAVFARWLEKSPLRASRFMPMVEALENRHAT